MSTLESVVGEPHVAAWEEQQVEVIDSPLVQFHAKYWGVTMEEEVNEWLKTLKDEDMDIEGDGDGDEAKDKEEENEVKAKDEEEDDEAKAKAKAKEEDEEEDEEGEGKVEDYIKGCYALDINIEGIEGSIWVRAEYVRIFDHIAQLHDDLTQSKRIDKRSYCVILTGQPGIGEFNLAEFICLSALKTVCA